MIYKGTCLHSFCYVCSKKARHHTTYALKSKMNIIMFRLEVVIFTAIRLPNSQTFVKRPYKTRHSLARAHWRVNVILTTKTSTEQILKEQNQMVYLELTHYIHHCLLFSPILNTRTVSEIQNYLQTRLVKPCLHILFLKHSWRSLVACGRGLNRSTTLVKLCSFLVVPRYIRGFSSVFV